MRFLSTIFYLLLAAIFTQAQTNQTFKPAPLDNHQLLLLGVERLSVDDFREALPILTEAARKNNATAVAWLAQAYHAQRRLTEASNQYEKLLTLVPPRKVSPAEQEAILRLAPRVFQVSSDPFALRDVIAIHHPQEPLIAYHFFWEDDIDFPDDNDPSDHEIVWIGYEPATLQISRCVTYFHGRMLESPQAVNEARLNGNRPRINVQWGKHGSMPYGWERLPIQPDSGDVESKYFNMAKPISLNDYNTGVWEKLHKEGRRHANGSLGSDWPTRFEGSYSQFVAFDHEVNIRSLLQQEKKMAVSPWNNATIAQRFLRYNFAPKTEWPDHPGKTGLANQLERRVGARLKRIINPVEWVALRRSLGDIQEQRIPRVRSLVDLPPMSFFKPETPRYPNIWFYAPVTDFPTYVSFIEYLDSVLKRSGYSAREVSLNEGADLAFSVEHLQPWDGVNELRHSHAVHIRLFWKRLEQNGNQRIVWDKDKTLHWQVAASVHYEVEHANPLHADVVICRFCGRTGAYADKPGKLVEEVHDPLGVELFLWGKIRGHKIKQGFDGFVEICPEAEIEVIDPFRSDMNTEVIATITLKNKK